MIGPERTSEDFVNDMLAKGRDWIAIVAVARFIRDGRWYEPARDMLQAKGLMPKDPALIRKLKEEAAKHPVPEEPKARFKLTEADRKKIKDRRAKQNGVGSADRKD